jgi:hypothetical protein
MATLASSDGVTLPVCSNVLTACATLAHATQHCTVTVLPVPFPAATLTMFLAALGDADQVPDDHLAQLVAVADYMACAPLLQRLAARLAATPLVQCDLSLEVWACVMEHVTLEAGCALALARPDLARVLQPRLNALARNVTLQCACSRGHLATCRWLTDTHGLTADNARSWRALQYAAGGGALPVCQWLTETFHLTPDDARADDNAALKWAMGNGHLPVCRWLADHFGLTADDVRADNNAALRWAASSGCLAACQWLAERFGLTADDVRADNRVLQSAADLGQLEVCQWLTETFHLTADDARADNNAALQVAASSGQQHVCEWLVKRFGLTAADAFANNHQALKGALEGSQFGVCTWLVKEFSVPKDDVIRCLEAGVLERARDANMLLYWMVWTFD